MYCLFRRLHRKWILSATAILAGLLLLFMAAWFIAPYVCEDPMQPLCVQTPVRSYYDSQGNLIFLERTYDYQWRFDTPLADIAPDAVSIILSAEDARFYSHHGVDYKAVCRAFWLNLRHGRVLSGASTISMQLCSMAHPKKRSFWNKFVQAAEARKLEQLHSKEEILTAYLNHIPFGGKLYGIQAASLYYFGLNAKDLNRAEASLLCGIPQRPNAFRPDRHLELARIRQRRVLNLMVRNHLLSQDEADDIFDNEPLRLRDFRVPSPLRTHSLPRQERHYLQIAKQEAGPHAYTIRCALHPEYTARILNVLKQRCHELPDVHDGAAVLIDNRTRRVLALIGTLDYSDPQAGQVNAATAIRSAGSTLKPFIYLEAFDAGIAVMDTVIQDAPIRFGTYSPSNYDGHFQQNIRIAEALSQSLNTPVIRLLAKLTPERVIRRFHSLMLLSHSRVNGTSLQMDTKQHGLAIALGTMGHSLLAISRAYAAIPNSGAIAPLSFLNDAPLPSASHVFSPEACAMVTRILTMNPLQSASSLDIAWKTGTSNGNHDAWCMGYTPDYTVGVWFGNKNGKASAALIGSSAAAPACADIFQAIYRNSVPTPWPSDQMMLPSKTLCSASGLLAQAACAKRFNGPVLKSVPLQPCNQCGAFAPQKKLLILSPLPIRYLAEPDGFARLVLQSDFSRCHWFIDGSYVGAIPADSLMPFSRGRHTIHAIDPTGKAIPAKLTFSVQ